MKERARAPGGYNNIIIKKVFYRKEEKRTKVQRYRNVKMQYLVSKNRNEEDMEYTRNVNQGSRKKKGGYIVIEYE